jgi:hypothetical protein
MLIRRLFPPEGVAGLVAEVMVEITRVRHRSPPRRHRSYPRVVKRARHNSYRVKRAGDVGVRHAGPATVELVNLGPTVRAA